MGPKLISLGNEINLRHQLADINALQWGPSLSAWEILRPSRYLQSLLRFNGAQAYQLGKFPDKEKVTAWQARFNGAQAYQLGKCARRRTKRPARTRFNGAQAYQLGKLLICSS